MSTPSHPTMSEAEAERYTPVSWLAVGALGLTVVSTVVIVGMWAAARSTHKPAYQPWMILPIALGFALAVAAKWSIRRADGAMTGAGLATAAWWVGLLVGGSFTAYVVATELAIRKQAEAFTLDFLAKVASEKPEIAFLECLEPEQRKSIIDDGSNVDFIRQSFGPYLHIFRINDLIRFLQRAGKDYVATSKGVKNWEAKEGGFEVWQVVDLRTPEGRFEFILPVFGADKPKLGGRVWYVRLKDARMADWQTTLLGRLLIDLQKEGKEKFVGEWIAKINRGEVFNAYLDTLPRDERAQYKGKTDAPGFQEFQKGSLVTVQAAGDAAELRKTFTADLLKPNHINLNPGSLERNEVVGPPQLEYRDGRVYIIHQVEVARSEGGKPPSVAYITTEVTGKALLQKIAELRGDNWRDYPILPAATATSAQPKDDFPDRGYRITGIEIRPRESRLGQPQGGPQGQ